ncbi:hypothetical protein FNV43_RR17613 [Rhamnella rubrinervis]|uniref:CRAL/TRIO N-terminal domain-containing protein n=1 Tax=Rhamnella rubrinervis TaxID=2594499 RepID=A0A8K0E2X8_9ROSA|nr:hypothetical protein FNV43_RR17613 [Rhamnella rubrinervis]
MFRLKKQSQNHHEDDSAQQEAKFKEYCTDACLKRYLEARNWNANKSKKMLEESLRWRATYKPEEIRWNTNSPVDNIRHLVYLLENAVLNLPEGQEQMSWLIDFTGFSLNTSVSVKTARDIINILQNHYPEACCGISL